ncbi:MAG: O-antigen ligase family protein [Bdellovibrionota bacterium]
MLTGSRIIGLGLGITAIIVSSEFSYYNDTAKFLLINLSLLSTALYCFTQNISLSFSKDKKTILSLSLLFACILIAAFFSKTGERVTGLAHIALASLLILNVVALSRQEGSVEFLKRFINIQAPINLTICSYLLFHILVFGTVTIPFFGNTNQAGNYVSISTLLLYFFRENQTKRSKKMLLNAALLMSLILLLLLKARAASIGLIMAYLYAEVFSQKIWSYKQFIRSRFGILITSLSLIGLFTIFYQKGILSVKYRLLFWLNTLCLVKDYPFGGGPGSFIYLFQNYNGKCFPSAELSENLLVGNPHNMFIEFAAEIGILGAFLVGVLIYFIAKEVLKKTKAEPSTSRWILSSGILLLSISFFEFPQDVAYTFFYSCIVLGVAFSLIGKKIIFSEKSRILNLALAFVILSTFSIKALSDHLTLYSQGRKDRYLSACILDKENWRGCALLGLTYIKNKDYKNAVLIIDKIAERFEGHHSLMRLRGALAEEQGNVSEACKQYKLFDSLYGGDSSKKSYIESNCH